MLSLLMKKNDESNILCSSHILTICEPGKSAVEVIRVMEFSVKRIIGHFTQTEPKALEHTLNLIHDLDASSPL